MHEIEALESLITRAIPPELREFDEDRTLKLAYLTNIEGDFDKALSLYDSIIKKDKSNARALNGKAVILDKLGEYNKAVEEFDKAIKYSDNALIPLVNKGLTLKKQKKEDEAQQCFREAIEIEPENEDIDQMINKAIAFYKLAKFQEAIILYNKILQLDEDNPRALVNLGNVYEYS
ncbi:MAG: tetratricopeptide repeat protein [Nitrososphaeraceae archaeon]